MGYTVIAEEFEQDENRVSRLIEETGVTVPGWSGVWEAVDVLIGEYGLPSGMEGWNEDRCVSSDHDCDEDPGDCKDNAREAVKEWIRSALEESGQRKIDFHFSGAERWAALTAVENWE